MASPKRDELYREALAEFKNQNLTVAIQKLEALLQKDPAFEDAYEALAICFSRAERNDEAVETAKQFMAKRQGSTLAAS